MKRKREHIEVRTTLGQPCDILRRNRRHIVERILDRWIYRSRWWSQEEERHYWNVQCKDLCIEIYESKGRWFASGIWD